MTYAAQGNRNTAQRIVNARRALTETLVNLGGIDAAAAEKVAAYYLKNKLAKLDPVMGSFNVKHGALLDAATIKLAASIVA